MTKFNVSKKMKKHLASLILSSHCAMIYIEHAQANFRVGKIDYSEYSKRMENAFIDHDMAVTALNDLLGSDIATYRYSTYEEAIQAKRIK